MNPCSTNQPLLKSDLDVQQIHLSIQQVDIFKLPQMPNFQKCLTVVKYGLKI
jgi:hypothetical protein